MLSDLITAPDPAVRDRPLAAAVRGLSFAQLLAERHALDRFRRESANLYDRVRALFFLYAIDRFHLPTRPELPATGRIPHAGVARLMSRRFDEAIRVFRAAEAEHGPSDPLASALAAAYHALAFQTLADQVRASVRGAAGELADPLQFVRCRRCSRSQEICAPHDEVLHSPLDMPLDDANLFILPESRHGPFVAIVECERQSRISSKGRS